MFTQDTVNQLVSSVAQTLNINEEKESLNAKEIEELVSASIYKCLTSTDFIRNMSREIVSKISR